MDDIITNTTSLFNSSGLIHEDITSQIPLFVVYIVVGVITAPTCLAIVLPIAYHVGLRRRKDYVVIAGLLLSDACNGLANIFAGTHRIYTILQKTNRYPYSRFWCYLRPEHLLWTPFESCSGLMQTVVSLDRLLFVSFPFWYISKDSHLGVFLCAIAYVPALAELVIGFILVIPYYNTMKSERLCVQIQALHDDHVDVHIDIMSYGASASVFMFAIVIIMHYNRNKKVWHTIPGSQKEKRLRTQRRLTRSVAISSLCTLITYVLPLRIIIFLNDYHRQSKNEVQRDTLLAFVSTVLWLTTMTNAIINPFLFITRHADIRIGLIAMLTRKPLPSNADNWMTVRNNTTVGGDQASDNVIPDRINGVPIVTEAADLDISRITEGRKCNMVFVVTAIGKQQALMLHPRLNQSTIDCINTAIQDNMDLISSILQHYKISQMREYWDCRHELEESQELRIGDPLKVSRLAEVFVVLFFGLLASIIAL